MDLANLWSQFQHQLHSELAQARAGLTHAGSKGTANEEAVARVLREHLPDSIGITSGQIIDTQGNSSKQIDIILYDASRTPIIYTSADKTTQVLPIEGVIAAVEVKTRVTVSDVPSIIANMQSVKMLKRSAYVPQSLTTVFNLYGQSYPYFPTVCSLFAFEVDNLESFGSALGDLTIFDPVDQRVDMACLLNKGVLLNADQAADRYTHTPTPSTLLGIYNTDNALMLWYILLSQLLLQAEQPPIDMSQYLPRDFAF